MYALHSSAAAACNLFHYWQRRGELALLARGLGLPSMNISRLRFEARYAVVEDDPRFPRAPNLDAALIYAGGRLGVAAIECKLCEPYNGRAHKGLSARYLELDEKWDGLSELHALASSQTQQERWVVSTASSSMWALATVAVSKGPT